jgi:hypothetical protein
VGVARRKGENVGDEFPGKVPICFIPTRVRQGIFPERLGGNGTPGMLPGVYEAIHAGVQHGVGLGAEILPVIGILQGFFA